MIQIIRANERYRADFGWLLTHWHFSFSDYWDPANVNWGALRVFNDDIVRGGGGFDTHPHRDMEIITYVLAGALEHKDSMGNIGVLRPGEVQVMSAGKGLMHSEYNHSKTDPVHFLQMWVLPRTKGSRPRWEQKQFNLEAHPGLLLPVVSSDNVPDTLSIDQDAVIYIASLRAGQEAAHELRPGRKAYLFAIAGELHVNGKPLSAGDQARVADESQLRLRAESKSDSILLDLPALS